MHNPRAEARKEAGCTYEEFLQQMKMDDELDAPLTELGMQQGRAVFETYNHLYQDRIELVVSSPLSRAIQTANYAVPKHNNRVCYEHVREINGWLLNAKRRSRQELRQQFPGWCFNALEHEDDVYWTEELESQEACSERGYQTLSWLLSRPEESIFLVAHGGILRFLMTLHERIVVMDGRKKKSGDIREPHARFGNCELRRYRLQLHDDSFQADESRPALVLTEIDLEHDS